MIDTKKQFPRLWNMLGIFHQDADEAGLELDELLERDLRPWGASAMDPIISDVQRALGYLDLDPKAFTPQDLGCEQLTPDYTTRSFLEMVLEKVQATSARSRAEGHPARALARLATRSVSPPASAVGARPSSSAACRRGRHDIGRRRRDIPSPQARSLALRARRRGSGHRLRRP